jgi:hypothetical protein
VVWDRVDGFLPNEAADLSARYATLDEAMLWCGRHPHCGGFTFGASVEERGGAVLHVAFKRTTEWFPDPQRTWASYIRRLTPCALALYSHRSGLTCCQGACRACPLEDAELVVKCEPVIAMQHGAFPTCSALEAPAAPLDGGGSRSWPPLRVMNIARAGIAIPMHEASTGRSISACSQMGLPVRASVVEVVLCRAPTQPKSSGWECNAPVTRTPVAPQAGRRALSHRTLAYRRVCARERDPDRHPAELTPCSEADHGTQLAQSGLKWRVGAWLPEAVLSAQPSYGMV